MREHDRLVKEIDDVLLTLEPDCLLALLSQARAMQRGQREYGKLDLHTSTRDWLVEALEECRDLANYLTFRILQLKDRK